MHVPWLAALKAIKFSPPFGANSMQLNMQIALQLFLESCQLPSVSQLGSN